MPRAYSPTALRAGAALGLVLGLVAPTSGQTTIFDSNGFEAPTYAPGNILNQQGFTFAPTNFAGVIQNTTARNGTQAFQVIGSNMAVPGFSGTGANFWYKDTFSYNPVSSGTPFVQVQFAGRRTTSGLFDMPLAGVYVEAISSSSLQQQLLTLTMSSDGRVTASTTAALGGQEQTVKTAPGLLSADNWHGLFAELNFATQTYRVYQEGDSTPLEFQTALGGTITDIPFRNSFGTSVSVKEIGMLAFNFNSGGGESAPGNNFFIDDYLVTASPTSLVPVPEPGLILAVGAVGLAGCGVYRRRRVALA